MISQVVSRTATSNAANATAASIDVSVPSDTPAESSNSSVRATEEENDHFIKKTDDSHINRSMGVGACALHPCLTRTAVDEPPTTAIEKLPEIKEIDVPSQQGSEGPDTAEIQLAELLAEHCVMRHKADLLQEGHSQSMVQMAQSRSSRSSSSSSEKSFKTPQRHMPRIPAAGGITHSESQSVLSTGALLTQRRRELELAGKRHSEATANAVRGLERGSNISKGTDTPTVELVQTAVSVREVSKLIGRTVVQMNNVRRIMIVTKPNDLSLVSLTRDLAIWLIESRARVQQPMVVYVEEHVARHRNFNLTRVHQKHPTSVDGLQYWTQEMCKQSPEIFDFAVTLGGDGTVLYTSWLFQGLVPPIIPFHLGSLGFLTVFDHRHARKVLDSAINSGVRINLRMRFTCTVYRLAETVDPERANVLNDAADCNRVIDHELATHGLQSYDDYEREEQCEEGDVSGAAKLAAINAMSGGAKPARSYSALKGSAGAGGAAMAADKQQRGPQPPVAARSSSGTNIGRSHGRRRSSVNEDSDVESSAGESAGPSGKRTPSVGPSAQQRQGMRGGCAGNSAKHGCRAASSGVSISAAAAAASSKSRGSPKGVPEGATLANNPVRRNSTLNESEWDDMPKAYQRRVRKVWKRDSTFQVMNEVVVDRGPSPYLSQIELYGDGNHLTTVEADGLCLATPTGSTAYSLAAGGSLVHPEIPAILVTPICPHTLSFRPMLLPDSMVIRVVLPPDSRNTAWASFDGRHRIELRRGDHIQITASKYPLPTVCASQSQTQDWMSSLSRCLNWNERKRQKKFAVPADGEFGEDESDEGGNIGDEGSDDDGDDVLEFK